MRNCKLLINIGQVPLKALPVGLQHISLQSNLSNVANTVMHAG